MSKAIKPKDGTYIDSSGITHNQKLLSTILESLKNLKFQTIYENADGGRDINIKAYGYGIYLLQMDSFEYSHSGLYVYRSETEPTQNIGFNYATWGVAGVVTRVSCNYQYPHILQAYRTDGNWPAFVRVIKLFDL